MSEQTENNLSSIGSNAYKLTFGTNSRVYQDAVYTFKAEVEAMDTIFSTPNTDVFAAIVKAMKEYEEDNGEVSWWGSYESAFGEVASATDQASFESGVKSSAKALA